MRSSANVIAAAVTLLTLFVSSAHAQSLQLPSDAEIRAQMATQRASTDAVLAQHVAPVPRGTFNTNVPVFNVPPPVHKPGLDDVLKQYANAKDGRPQEVKRGSDLIIFVSFSMPPDTLKELARQAREYGAVMVIRGFKKGSLYETKAAAMAVNKAGAPWEIHPELFKAFKVTTVPTFVVSSAEAESVLDNGCSPEATYSSVEGDISTDVALQTIARRAQPAIAKLAQARMDRIAAKNRQVSVQ